MNLLPPRRKCQKFYSREKFPFNKGHEENIHHKLSIPYRIFIAVSILTHSLRFMLNISPSKNQTITSKISHMEECLLTNIQIHQNFYKYQIVRKLSNNIVI